MCVKTETGDRTLTIYYRDLLQRLTWYVPAGQAPGSYLSAYAYVHSGCAGACFIRRKQLTSGLFSHHFVLEEQVSHLIRGGTRFRPGSGNIAGRVHWAQHDADIPWRPLI